MSQHDGQTYREPAGVPAEATAHPPTQAEGRKPPNRSKHRGVFPFFHDIRGRVTRWDVESEGWRDPPHPGDGWGDD